MNLIKKILSDQKSEFITGMILFFILCLAAHYSFLAADVFIVISVIAGSLCLYGFVRGIVNIIEENKKMKENK